MEQQVVENIVVIVVFLGTGVMGGLVGNILGWRSGRKIGQREGFQKYLRQLRFERRDETILIPTDQPHSRRPKGQARVTTAHVSQVRRNWSGT